MKVGPWKKIGDAKEVLKTPILSVFEQASESTVSKKKGNFQLVKAPHWNNTLAITKDKQVVLVNQYRHGIDEICLELPGGACDFGEDPLLAAQRELVEETGYKSTNWIKLGDSHVNPAFMDNKTYFYLALDCELVEQQNLDSNEEIEVTLRPLSEIPKMIEQEVITHSLVHASFMYYLMKGYSFS